MSSHEPAKLDDESKTESRLIFLGCYTKKQGHTHGTMGEGISVYRWHPTKKTLEFLNSYTCAGVSPTALCRSGNVLYAVSEDVPEDLYKTFIGKIVSYKINSSGKDVLTRIDHQPTNGNAACFVSTTSDGKRAFVANYISGSLSSYMTDSDGSMIPLQTFSHARHWEKEHVSNEGRQGDGAHCHCAEIHPNGQFVYCCDLGCDKIVIYKLEDKLALHSEIGPIKTPSGSGPRHLSFHPSGRFAYVSNELDCTVGVYSCDLETGALTELQMTSSLHCKFDRAVYSCSQIQVHQSGAFVCVANRGLGDDSLTLFRVDQETGMLGKPVFNQHKGEKTIRHFTFDPSGNFVFTSFQDSNKMVVFAVNQETLELAFVVDVASGSPSWVEFHSE